MALLKWEAIILNKLYKTQVFSSIVLQSDSTNSIDYLTIVDCSHQLQIQETKHRKQIMAIANVVCRTGVDYIYLRQKIVELNECLQEIPVQQYTVDHVMVYSSLSKCKIWPKMLKHSMKLTPRLINFYNGFSKDFNQHLDFKFDPIILSHKYTKIMHRIHESRKTNPELMKAIMSNDCPGILELVKDNDKLEYLNHCEDKGMHATHVAVSHSTLETITLLHKLGADFQLLDKENQTPIFYAIKRADMTILRFLVEKIQVNINHCEYQNRPALYLAAFEGNTAIVSYLYDKGADPNIKSKLQRTPLSKACYLGNLSVTEFLVSVKVDITSQDNRGRTALHNAAWGVEGGREGKRRGHQMLEDSPKCVQLLLQAGHPVDLQDFDGFTPLFSAASSLAIRSMLLLIKRGANLSHQTNKGETVVFIGAKYGHLPVINILIEQYGQPFMKPNKQGYTPLMASITLDSSECFFYLLQLQHKDGRLFDLLNMISCSEQYKKQENLDYIKIWLEKAIKGEDKAKQEYLYRCIKQCVEEDDLIGGLKKLQFGSKVNYKLLCILNKLSSFLSGQTLRGMLTESLSLLNQHKHPEHVTLFLECYEHLKARSEPQLYISGVEIHEELNESHIIELLRLNSNLTSNSNLKQTLFRIVSIRATKVLLWVLNQATSHSQGTQCGIEGYSREYLRQLIYHQEDKDTLNIYSFCLLNGIHDIAKIINDTFTVSQHNQQNPPFRIPDYQYEVTNNNKDLKPCLKAVDSSHLQPQQLLSNLSLSEREYYHQYLSTFNLNSYSQIKIILVDSEDTFISMEGHIFKNYLIGIDIEHFTHNKQAFICLIQIATADCIFLIDRFKCPTQRVRALMQKLMESEWQLKVFHSYENDIRWLSEDFQVGECRQVLDTSKIYMLSHSSKDKSPSLKWLSKELLGYDMKKDFQKADWRIRPFFKEMLEYAALDARLLCFLSLYMLSNCQMQPVIDYFGKARDLRAVSRRNHVQSAEEMGQKFPFKDKESVY